MGAVPYGAAPVINGPFAGLLLTWASQRVVPLPDQSVWFGFDYSQCDDERVGRGTVTGEGVRTPRGAR